MKKNILLMVVMMLSFTMMAQRNAESPMGERQLARMKAELSLSDEQVTRITEANKKFRQDEVRLRSDTSLTRKQIMDESRALSEARVKTMKEILTVEQYEKWMSMKPGEIRQASQVRRANPMEVMKKELGLSDEQARKITAINATTGREFQKLPADTTLSQDDRIKAQKQIMEKRNAQIKEALTKEQYEKFLVFEKERIADRRTGGRQQGRPRK